MCVAIGTTCTTGRMEKRFELYNGADEKRQQAAPQQNQQLANEPESGREDGSKKKKVENNNPLTWNPRKTIPKEEEGKMDV